VEGTGGALNLAGDAFFTCTSGLAAILVTAAFFGIDALSGAGCCWMAAATSASEGRFVGGAEGALNLLGASGATLNLAVGAFFTCTSGLAAILVTAAFFGIGAFFGTAGCCVSAPGG
jgi:hypothetical protein